MEHPSSSRTNQKAPLIHEWPDCLEGDPRLSLSRRIVAGRHFAKSPLLSKFFLYVVTETLAGRQAEITEHQIGVQVFGRSPSYLTVEDNIVRNYARQLRRRLAEHFAGEGFAESLRVEIPHGGYIPVFTRASDVRAAGEQRNGPMPENVGTHLASGSPPSAVAPIAARRNWQRLLLRAVVLAASAAVLISLTWFAAVRTHAPSQAPEPARPLWAALFDGPANSYIVPADAGFNLLEDLSRRPLSLADYIKGGYLELPLAEVDAHSAQDLRSQQFTSFVDLQIVAALALLREFNPQRVILHFPRDLRLDDLKNANAVIIGSVGSNPWAAIAGDSSNFGIVYREDMQEATLVNRKPQSGEASSYVSHWNEPAHETFAVISFLPNLGGNGHLLLLQGLDVAGTQAAAEVLFRQDALAPVLRRATRPDGSLRFFEVLLRATSIQSSAAGTQVIAFRIH
jgi:hypothetical protein